MNTNPAPGPAPSLSTSDGRPASGPGRGRTDPRARIDRLALHGALVYGLVSGLWIAFSDWGLAMLVSDPHTVTRLSVVKGWLFVGVTGGLLYGVLRRSMRRLQAEADARAESETAVRQWADAFSQCAHGIVLSHPGSECIVVCNPAYARIHGTTPQELAGSPLTDMYVAGDVRKAREAIAEADRTGHVHFEATKRRKDGSVFPAQMDMVSVRDDRGQLIYRVGTTQDITERKRAEAALRESEERFRAVVENIHEVFWMVEAKDRRMLYVSPNYETVWGRKPEELYATPEAWLESLHPEDRDRVRDAVRTKQAAGTYDEEFRIVRPDGTERWIRDRAFPIRPGGGPVERIVGVAEDVTERRHLESQFLRAQRMEAIGTLAGGIAHDLNNILAPMLMAAGLLKESVSDVRDRDMLSMVERSARRGADIIRQLLTFSRGIEGARAPVQVRHLLKEMAGIVRETFPREIRLVEETSPQLWAVVADATQLHQVLVNLCVNARDAMPEGGQLTMSARNVELGEDDVRTKPGARPGRHVLIAVGDTGVGMPAEIIERIFDPFFTTKDIGKGTGLGLSTVLGIVRSHGGFVTVTSRPGQGSTFSVFLPAAPTEADESDPPATESLPSGDGELVLVVDDEEPIRDAMQHVLEAHNYRVITAKDGKDAITVFLRQREAVKLVVTDVMMPEMGGAALIRALRLLNSQLKVIATSGLDTEGKSDDLAVLGVTTVLPKPCGPRMLLEAVRHVMAG